MKRARDEECTTTTQQHQSISKDSKSNAELIRRRQACCNVEREVEGKVTCPPLEGKRWMHFLIDFRWPPRLPDVGGSRLVLALVLHIHVLLHRSEISSQRLRGILLFGVESVHHPNHDLCQYVYYIFVLPHSIIIIYKARDQKGRKRKTPCHQFIYTPYGTDRQIIKQSTPHSCARCSSPRGGAVLTTLIYWQMCDDFFKCNFDHQSLLSYSTDRIHFTLNLVQWGQILDSIKISTLMFKLKIV